MTDSTDLRLDEVLADLQRMEQEHAERGQQGYTTEDLCERWAVGKDRCRAMIKRAIQRGLMKSIPVVRKSLLNGRRYATFAYEVVRSED